jgi:acetyl/propionyl-CoA carboxylase alpha subunit
VTKPFSRVAIVNRGESAMRFIHAAREWSAESRGQVRTIALYSEPERGAMFVREADEAICVGSSDERGRLAGAAVYLDHRELEWALRTARADAVWVGWGFVAEDPVFAELCARLGVTFIGPSPDVMRTLGDKISAKALAEQTGVPVAAWSGGAVTDLADAQRHAADIGYPLMIKAAAGGGGRGIRSVAGPEELATAFERSRGEALRAFGDGTVFMERVVSGARHVEVQTIADDYGSVWPLGVRDCSVQRRNQKVIEESASPVLTAAQDDALRKAAADLARAAGYRNAGTVEFIVNLLAHGANPEEVLAELGITEQEIESYTGPA